MIVFTKLVSLDQFGQLVKDRSYTKLVVRRSKNSNLHNCIRVRCYHSFDSDSETAKLTRAQFIKTLLKESNNNNLPNEIREKFGGFYSYATEHGGCIRESKFKKLLEIEKEYNLNLYIPKKFRKILN